ncbi:BUD13 homolog [Dendrobium catenatum]|uniref:BUD13 homolog n=1 Tax=Dendrobium catenatum TaxID=906689 RepID=A0A2I0X2B3_9ASPA|nr:BUD13 homolog [Dendrobium catenatum]PKU82049.1 hypothetical protein MA16_Dca004066 [Dendrobium catenatum]
MAASSSVSLKEYLKRYQSGTDEPKKAKKKKSKEKLKPLSTGGVLVVDNDPIWQKPVQLDDAEEEDNFAGDETPQVEEDIEVKRMKRLQALRSVRPYHGINEDGSGWVSIPKPSRPSAAKGQDLSPQLNKHDFGNSDLSPTYSDKDLSPPRQRRRRLDTPSPEPGLSGHGGEARDLSPPRKRRVEDLSPPHHGKFRTQEVEAGRGSREDDLSPPRKPVKGAKKGPLEDLSPPRKARSSPVADLSPPRRIRKMSPDDLSPPRRASKRSLEPTDMQSSSFPDLSHTTKGQFGSSQNSSAPRRVHHGSLEGRGNTNLPSAGPLPPRIKEPSFTQEAKSGGILSRKEMREETDRKRMEAKSRFAAMDPLLTGRGAEVVFRDKEGNKVSKEELMKSKEKKKEERPLEWGKGLAQKREAEERGKELEREKERPFARSRDDPELDKMLKERLRWGDPMAHLVKRKTSELILEDFAENEKMKESGFVVPQSIPTHSWLKRGLDFTPNRYGIKPGRHWDGVDRSNGYEKELFKRQNEKRATETEAYLWSVSDM